MHRVHEYRHQHEAHDKKLYCSRTLSSPVKAPPLSLLFLLLLACMAFKLKGISFTSSSGRLRPRYSSKVHPLGMTNDAYKHVGMLPYSDRCKILLLLHLLTPLMTKCINNDKLRQVFNSPPPPTLPPFPPLPAKSTPGHGIGRGKKVIWHRTASLLSPGYYMQGWCGPQCNPLFVRPTECMANASWKCCCSSPAYLCFCQTCLCNSSGPLHYFDKAATQV